MSEREGGGKRKGGKESPAVNPKHFFFFFSPTNRKQQCNLIGYQPINQNMTSEICLSCIIRHPEHNKIKIDIVESGEALEGVFEFYEQGNIERPFAKWQTHRCKTEPRSCHQSLVHRQVALAIDLSNTRRRLHGYHYHLHVASQKSFFIIHHTHYEKSDWSRTFNQFTIACDCRYCSLSCQVQRLPGY